MAIPWEMVVEIMVEVTIGFVYGFVGAFFAIFVPVYLILNRRQKKRRASQNKDLADITRLVHEKRDVGETEHGNVDEVSLAARKRKMTDQIGLQSSISPPSEIPPDSAEVHSGTSSDSTNTAQVSGTSLHSETEEIDKDTCPRCKHLMSAHFGQNVCTECKSGKCELAKV